MAAPRARRAPRAGDPLRARPRRRPREVEHQRRVPAGREQLGVNSETLRSWVKQGRVDARNQLGRDDGRARASGRARAGEPRASTGGQEVVPGLVELEVAVPRSTQTVR
jgi:hypothetical protein